MDQSVYKDNICIHACFTLLWHMKVKQCPSVYAFLLLSLRSGTPQSSKACKYDRSANVFHQKTSRFSRDGELLVQLWYRFNKVGNLTKYCLDTNWNSKKHHQTGTQFGRNWGHELLLSSPSPRWGYSSLEGKECTVFYQEAFWGELQICYPGTPAWSVLGQKYSRKAVFTPSAVRPRLSGEAGVNAVWLK